MLVNAVKIQAYDNEFLLALRIVHPMLHFTDLSTLTIWS